MEAIIVYVIHDIMLLFLENVTHNWTVKMRLRYGYLQKTLYYVWGNNEQIWDLEIIKTLPETVHVSRF